MNRDPLEMSPAMIEKAVLAEKEKLRRHPKLAQALKDPVLGPQVRKALGMPETPERETRQQRRSRERMQKMAKRQNDKKETAACA